MALQHGDLLGMCAGHVGGYADGLRHVLHSLECIANESVGDIGATGYDGIDAFSRRTKGGFHPATGFRAVVVAYCGVGSDIFPDDRAGSIPPDGSLWRFARDARRDRSGVFCHPAHCSQKAFPRVKVLRDGSGSRWGAQRHKSNVLHRTISMTHWPYVMCFT